MPITKIHHINFLVKDLQKGMECYSALLGLKDFILDELPDRGVRTARVAVGEQWIVLVEPIDPEGIPGQHLAQHGEGFFLISYAVDDIDNAARQVARYGSSMTSPHPRQGLDNWRVWDVDSKDTLGIQLQFCQEN